MKQIAALAAALGFAACATAPQEIAPLDPSVSDAGAAVSGELQPLGVAGVDATDSTYWTAIEKPWPEAPELVLINSAISPIEPFAMSFACNQDTGAMTGAVLRQDGARVGEAAMFRLETTLKPKDVAAVDLTNNAPRTTELAGVFEVSGDGAAFDFPVDWLTLNMIGDADKAVVYSQSGAAEVALIAADVFVPNAAKVTASLDQFTEAANQFYYFCNPK